MVLRIGVFIAAVAMAVFSILTMQHYFATNYPGVAASPCSQNTPHLNCAAAASSPVAAVALIPIGYFGLCLAVLFGLGALFNSDDFEGTNRLIAAVNMAGVVALFFYSLFHVHAICPLCAGYYVSSLVAFVCLYLRKRRVHLSLRHVAAFVLVAALGGWGVREYHKLRAAKPPAPVAPANPFVL